MGATRGRPKMSVPSGQIIVTHSTTWSTSSSGSSQKATWFARPANDSRYRVRFPGSVKMVIVPLIRPEKEHRGGHGSSGHWARFAHVLSEEHAFGVLQVVWLQVLRETAFSCQSDQDGSDLLPSFCRTVVTSVAFFDGFQPSREAGESHQAVERGLELLGMGGTQDATKFFVSQFLPRFLQSHEDGPVQFLG